MSNRQKPQTVVLSLVVSFLVLLLVHYVCLLADARYLDVYQERLPEQMRQLPRNSNLRWVKRHQSPEPSDPGTPQTGPVTKVEESEEPEGPGESAEVEETDDGGVEEVATQQAESEDPSTVAASAGPSTARATTEEVAAAVDPLQTEQAAPEAPTPPVQSQPEVLQPSTESSKVATDPASLEAPEPAGPNPVLETQQTADPISQTGATVEEQSAEVQSETSTERGQESEPSAESPESPQVQQAVVEAEREDVDPSSTSEGRLAQPVLESGKLKVESPPLTVESAEKPQVEAPPLATKESVKEEAKQEDSPILVGAREAGNATGAPGEQARMVYKIEPVSCANIEPLLPAPILNMTVERILRTLSSANCSARLELKLAPATNTAIRGRVMEVSSMPVGLEPLADATSSLVVCSAAPKAAGTSGGKSVVQFAFTIEQELRDLRLRSQWRQHRRLQGDDIALGPFASRGAQPYHSNARCEPFRLDRGDFYLDLWGVRTRLSFEVQLVKLDERSYAASAELGGQIRLTQFRLEQAQLSQDVWLSRKQVGARSSFARNQQAGRANRTAGAGSPALPESSSAHLPTVQVLHERNQHQRRNNWLLNVYGNWLKHEYRRQLEQASLADTLTAHVNSCLAY